MDFGKNITNLIYTTWGPILKEKENYIILIYLNAWCGPFYIHMQGYMSSKLWMLISPLNSKVIHSLIKAHDEFMLSDLLFLFCYYFCSLTCICLNLSMDIHTYMPNDLLYWQRPQRIWIEIWGLKHDILVPFKNTLLWSVHPCF